MSGPGRRKLHLWPVWTYRDSIWIILGPKLLRIRLGSYRYNQRQENAWTVRVTERNSHGMATGSELEYKGASQEPISSHTLWLLHISLLSTLSCSPALEFPCVFRVKEWWADLIWVHNSWIAGARDIEWSKAFYLRSLVVGLLRPLHPRKLRLLSG